MKVAVLSDIHDNLTNLCKSLDWCREQKIEIIICCGDLTNIDTLNYLARNFKGKVHLVQGNADSFYPEDVVEHDNIILYKRAGGSLEIDGVKIGFCHEPVYIKSLLAEDNFDLIFYGHTHKPWESQEKGARLINPGTLSGMFLKSTFAVWNSQTGEMNLKILEEM